MLKVFLDSRAFCLKTTRGKAAGHQRHRSPGTIARQHLGPGNLSVFIWRPPTVVASQIQYVDLLKMGSQVAVHQGMALSDRQAVLELVAIVGSFARLVDFAAGEVPRSISCEQVINSGNMQRNRILTTPLLLVMLSI